ncbi:ABC transporter permease [Miltoncostaea oceani]|uniref:ABC transporter permease n=1 Tax=Miltoncostaea oceani TaxID=2843216 RepID=UPI001C3C6BFF|nr:ABC transporter permease [Miltoncostaea oceani]
MTAAQITRHAPLFRNLARREVRQRYKGSVLGLAWALVTPAIMVGAYSVVFKFLLKIEIPNYALFLFVGLTVWTFFMGGAQVAARSLVGNASLVTKVSFPRQIVPLAAITGNGFTAAAMLAVALPLCVLLTEGARLPLVLLPVLIVLLAAFTIGFGLLVAALNVYFRDVEHILGAVAMPWIFLSPVFYSFDTVPGGAGREWAIDLLHYANPIAPFILTVQDTLFWGRWPALGDVVYSVVAAAVVLGVGWWAFRRLEPEMAVEL